MLVCHAFYLRRRPANFLGNAVVGSLWEALNCLPQSFEDLPLALKLNLGLTDRLGFTLQLPV